MLKFAEFDIKTGKPILAYDPNTQGQAQSYKEVDIAYLQHWLRARGLERAPLYTADFYQGINPSDNERLLKQGKHVIFTGGTSGKFVSAYFTDAATATAILIGNDREPPLYELGDKSAHYAVAYGSLPISDCYKDAVVKGGKGRAILIVDDEAQSIGSKPITDRDGKPVEDVRDLLSLMGDGTMLLPTGLMRELLLEKEVNAIIRQGIERTDRDLNAELGVVGEWLDEVTGDKVEDELVALIAAEYRANGRIGTSHVHLNAAKTINKLLDKAADESVIQFRAAITDTPGMFKGMMKTSKWCERLGVAAIVSKNCIKGNGVDLDTVGILELNKGSTLWVGRKEVATWGEQSVGMQVKICIPAATERELNPLALAKAGQLTEIAVDPYLLGQKYIADDRRKKSNLAIVIDDNGEVSGQVRQKDALADLLALDVNGEITQMPTIQRRLTEALRTSWIDAATSGVEVPSAVAQHHGKLDVWEICNRQLPHGAVVAFYRSPVPNVSAFAFGVNNLDLKDIDPESYNKRGVVYVNPWTAKEIAISDFDGDRFGQFVGYVANDPAAFIAALREVVSAYQSPVRRYEAFHAAMAQSIRLGTELERSTFPLSVAQLAVATSLEHRPQQIKKAEKKPHPWERSHDRPISEAIFTAWTNVAANPISKVANLGMNLQMLAQNAINTPINEKATLLHKIGMAFEKLKVIPNDEYLLRSGLPALNLATRIERVKVLSKELSLQEVTQESTQSLAEPLQRRIAQGLAEVATILKDYAEYPIASQLQIAVDSLKSRTGINGNLFDFGQALCYQKNEVRAELKADWVYSIDKSHPHGLSTVLPANTYEPIGEHVRAVNDIFESVLQAQRDIKIGREDLNAAFRQIVPLTHNSQDSSMVDGYVSQYRATRDILGVATARQNEQRPEDKQPTLTITSANSGKTFEVHRTIQAQSKNTVNKNRVWELEPGQVYRFSIAKNPTVGADPYLVNLIDAQDRQISILGSTTYEMLEQGNFDIAKLAEAVSQRASVKLQGRVELHPPRMMINDTDRHKAVMTQVLANLKAAISPEREDAALSAIWYGNQSTDRRVRNSSAGMSIATKILPDRLGTYLGVKRTLDLGSVSEYGGILADANTTLDLRIDNLIKKEGAGAVPVASAIFPDGSTVELGSILKSAPPPPPGSILAGTVTRKVRDIDLVLGSEKRKVVPSNDLASVGLIDRTSAKFAFKVGVEGVEVSAIHGNSTTVLGTLVPKSRDRTDTIPSSNDGSFERTLHTHQIEVHVREFVAHQPVSDILSGEPLILPREINSHLPPLQPPRHQPPPPERYLPNRAEIVGWYQAAVATNNADDTQYLIQIGQQLKTAYMREPFMQGQPPVETLPDDYHHATVSISIEDKQRLDSTRDRPSPSYHPTRADVVKWYKAAVKVNADDTQYLIDLGTQLKTAYLSEPFMQGHSTVERLPDEYQHPSISMSMEDKHRLDAMSIRANEPSQQRSNPSRSR